MMRPESTTIASKRGQNPAPATTPSASGTAAWCADWRDPEAYPAADAGASVFAWQFLRRNEAYVAAFAAFAELVDCGGTDLELHQLHDKLSRSWGVIALADPARQSPPLWRRGGIGGVGDDDASALDDRFTTITFDAARPLRPQLVAAQVVVTDAALRWLAVHPDDAPAAHRIGGERNGAVFRECLRVLDATRLGVPKREIQRVLWPALDHDDQRERLRHRLRRATELVEGGYRELAAADADEREIRRSLISPSAPPVDRIP